MAKVAQALGKPLMPWQRHVADVVMELLPDGTLCYDRVVVTVPRQAGKSTLLLAILTHRCQADLPGGRLDVGPQKQTVVYTAQTRNDARKKWVKEFTPLLERSPFARSFSKRMTNGSEGFDWANGSTFDLVATMEKSGHGDTLDLGMIDEAFAQVDDRLEQAMEPATLTRTSSQLWIVSTAGESPEKSPFLWGYVDAGRRAIEHGTPSRTAYFEWSVPDDEDCNDPEVVAGFHPAVGHTITVDDIANKHQKAIENDNLAGYRRAYCNQWGKGKVLPPKIPADAWAHTISAPTGAGAGEVTIAFDVSLDGEWSSIAIAAGSIIDPYIEVIEHRQGVGWLPGRLAELVARWDPIAVGCNGAGPTPAQVGPVLAAFQAAKISADVLHQLTAGAYKAACGGFYTDVTEGRLRRPDGQGPLDLAAADATERPLGDAWAWDLRQASVPISPLIAATIARALLPTEPQPKPYDVLASVF